MNQTDIQYEERQITAVEGEQGGGWDITRDDGWHFFVPPNGPKPHVGDTARFYGEGIGRPIRGLTLNGVVVFYRTPEQQREQARLDHERYVADKKQRWAEHAAEYQQQYDGLPAEFQARIDRFRRNNPDFDWDHGPYEFMVCQDAVRIAGALGTGEAIHEFHEAPWEQQTAAVPDLNEGHSGNSFGAACHLARLYVEHPELVDKAHGALCPLVGCKDYGCYAAEVQP